MKRDARSRARHTVDEGTSTPGTSKLFPSRRLIGRCDPPGFDGAAWIVADTHGLSLLNVFRLVEVSV